MHVTYYGWHDSIANIVADVRVFEAQIKPMVSMVMWPPQIYCDGLTDMWE
jgi:hypothetical protein